MSSDLYNLGVVSREGTTVRIRFEARQSAAVFPPLTRTFVLGALQELAPTAFRGAIPMWQSYVPRDRSAFLQAAIDEIRGLRVLETTRPIEPGPEASGAPLPSTLVEVDLRDPEKAKALIPRGVAPSALHARRVDRQGMQERLPAAKPCMATISSWKPKRGAPATLDEEVWSALSSWCFHDAFGVVKGVFGLASMLGDEARRFLPYAVELTMDSEPGVRNLAVAFLAAHGGRDEADTLASMFNGSEETLWLIARPFGRIAGNHAHWAETLDQASQLSPRAQPFVDWVVWRCTQDPARLARWAANLVATTRPPELLCDTPVEEQPAIVHAVIGAMLADPEGARRCAADTYWPFVARGLADPAPLRDALKRVK